MPIRLAFLCFLQLILSNSAFAQEGSQGMALTLPLALTAQEQFNLGNMYLNGQGVPKSDWEAAAWFRKASDQGLAGAQYALGKMYENGRGVPQDNTQAVAWYRKAAEQGFEEAKTKLAELEALQNPKRDPNDVVAQVLNYTVFGSDEGCCGYFWHKDPSGSCRYRLHISSNELGFAQNQRHFIDLDNFDPKSITFRSTPNSGTVVMSDIEILFSNARELKSWSAPTRMGIDI